MSTTPEPDRAPTHPTNEAYTGMPTWVRWALLAILAGIAILVVARFVVGGEHGPGRHMSTAAAPVAGVASTLLGP